MNNKETFATKCGRWLGILFVGCITACLSAILIAAAVRFILWLI